MDSVLELRFLGNINETIKAVKLELGTQQTLAHQDTNGVWVLNEIPDYGEQLARCQRYRRPLESVLCAVSDLQNERYFLSSITYPTMRKTPTIEIQTVDNNVGVIQGVQYIKNTELGVYSVSDSVLSLYIPSSVVAGSAVAGKMAEIFKIWLNAEL